MGLGEVVAEVVATPPFRGSGNNIWHTTEGFYGRLKNELFHWTGPASRMQALWRCARLFGGSAKRETLEGDQTFLNPSAAAVFVLGSSQNGWVEWTNDEGKTLHEVYHTTEQSQAPHYLRVHQKGRRISAAPFV